MTNILTQAWEEYLKPIFFRPKRLQVAALCYRETGGGKEILMITSRGTGRWILPKGWPIKGKDGPQSALQEAWEEAGVEAADVSADPVGHYEYRKIQDNGTAEPVETLVYAARVAGLADDYPEAGERRRQWMRPAEAANLVQEPQLQDLLRQL